MTGKRSRARDPELIDTTSRLLEFLRDLATTRRESVRDVTDYPQVRWLADLPSQAIVSPDAGPGERVLSIDLPAGEPPPELPVALDGWMDWEELLDAKLEAPDLRTSGPAEVVRMDISGQQTRQQETRPLAEATHVRPAYDEWLPQWRAWAARERVVADQRRWHHALHAIANDLSQREDELELVLATGLLTWRPAEDVRIRNHLLCTRAHIVIDSETRRIDVELDESMVRLQDRELLDRLSGYQADRVDRARDRVHQGEAVGLKGSVSEVLKEWCERALDHGAVYLDDWESGQSTAATEVRIAPALVLRKRDRASLVDYYDRMLRALKDSDPAAPLGLAQLVTPLEDEERTAFLREQGAASGDVLGADPLFPLAANPEQRHIMSRLRSSNGVVVQGPPGTGKTHTIANLMSALLSQGQRVLVTSQKAQALQVLREKLPEPIKGLCVSMTDLGRGGSSELEGSVKALSARFDGFDAAAQQRTVERLRDRLRKARRSEAELAERVRTLREAETYQHDEISPGYQGTLAEIARRLKHSERTCGWIPVPLPQRAGKRPPIDAAEAAELLALLADETPKRKDRPLQLLPEPAALPQADRMRALVAAEAAASDLAQQAETDVSRQLAACGPELLAKLEGEADAVASRLEHLDLAENPQEWDKSDWVVRAIEDGLLRRETLVWERLVKFHDRAGEAREAVEIIGLREVTLPTFDQSDGNSETAQLEAGRQLRDYLAGGGKLRRAPFKPAVQRQAERLLSGAFVNGVRPESVELLDLVLVKLNARVICDELARGWRDADVGIPLEQPLPLVVSKLNDHHDRLARVMEISSAVERSRQQLTASGVRVKLSRADGWHAYATSLRAVRLRLEAEQATADLEALRAQLDLEIRKGQAPPELLGARSAVSGREADTYEECLRALATAHGELRDQVRCDELLEKVRQPHPALATLMIQTSREDHWRARLGVWAEAWAWGKAQTFFNALRDPGLERRLEAELEAATELVLKAQGELAAEQAWAECLSRMNASHAQALRQYQDYMTKRGQGTGKFAPRFRKRAKEAMERASPAVPAWVMPLRQVLETVPPLRDSFDVVIVDEASQANIDDLFLLWLAPRVIVVGDDKQCAPSEVSHGALEPIFNKLASYLPDMPAYLRDAFTPKSSLFDLLSTRFGAVIRLREHFRCMPEIIGYSSRQFYADEPLVPMRQFGADRLPPLRVVRVHGATTEGTSTKLRNEVEADQVVEQVIRCCKDPAYHGKTFGVVVLQGSGQVQLIHDKLLAQIEPKEWDRHKLRVGAPPDFQGDERDVVFLSMVVAERRSATRGLQAQRRFNVAASRAKDQMWLFHSVSPDLLSPKDLRRSLLAYMLNPPAPFAKRSFDHITPDVLVQPFDSLFEQRVFLRIRERGYHVTPQVEVNGRRIDLVVSGAKGQLAVECDGDFWHSTPEDRENDLDRERELKRAGWRFWRLRESEFYFAPESALASLWEDLDLRGIRPHEVDEVQEGPGEADWSAVELSDEEGWDGLEDGDPSELDERSHALLPQGRQFTASGKGTSGTNATSRRRRRPGSAGQVEPTSRATDRPPNSWRQAGTASETIERARGQDQLGESVKSQAGAADPESLRSAPPLRPGRSVSTYTRRELQDLLRWVAADGQPRSEDDLVAAAASVLKSPDRRQFVEGWLRSGARALAREADGPASEDEPIRQTRGDDLASTRTGPGAVTVEVPEGYRSVAWVRPEEAKSTLECYRTQAMVPIWHDSKVTGWARYHPKDSEFARKYRAEVVIERAGANGARAVCWIREHEAAAVLEAARVRDDADVTDQLGRHVGKIQYFPPGSPEAQKYRSVTRLLRERGRRD